jgi:glucoamylase
VGLVDLAAVAPYLFWLMFRNVASDGLIFEDPVNSGVLSLPGCVLAAPSWENAATQVRQDYVYNWTRDAAIVAMELAEGILPTSQPLLDYVRFARVCQTRGGDFDRASYLIDGTPRDWSDQSDGPALQTLAILRVFSRLDDATSAIAGTVVGANLDFLQNTYQAATVNLWEEAYGASFFTRAVHRRCLAEIQSNSIGITVPEWAGDAIAWLDDALASHWNGTYYQSVAPAPADRAPYDPNIDIVLACVYGSVPVGDTRLLATAGLLRDQWADPASRYFYPINGDDQQRGVGPLLGRYPGDVYDGDTDAQAGDPPWAISTACFAELYYRLAAHVTSTDAVPVDDLSANFFAQAGVTASDSPPDAAAALRTAGDRMLSALLFHSDHLELSEQFDAVTGFEKSVRNLSWSYAAFLSAVRARGLSASSS